MFQELKALLKSSSSISLTIAEASADRITVTVVPKTKMDADEPKLATPLSLTGTPEELDQEFGALLLNYTEQHASLAEQLEATTAIMQAAKKDSEKKATKALSKPLKETKEVQTAAPAEGGDDNGDDSGSGDVKPQTTEPVGDASTTENLWG